MDAERAPTLTDTSERPSSSGGKGWLFAPLEWVRPLAALAVVATLVGRALSPALRGSLTGVDALVERTQDLGAVLSHMLLFTSVALLLGTALVTLRVTRLPLAYRLIATALAGVVLGLSAPASSAKLSPELSGLLSLATVLMALLGSTQALLSPHTRAIGAMLGTMSLAALTRQVAWMLAILGGERALLKLSYAARSIAMVAFGLQVLAISIGTLWLVSRRQRGLNIGLALSLLAARFVSLFVEGIDAMGVAPWKQILGSAALRLLAPPVLLMPTRVRVMAEVFALAMAGLALLTTKQSPVVLGIFSLVLVAGMDTDIPLCALCMAVASLSAALAAHDPRATFWALLTDRRPDSGA